MVLLRTDHPCSHASQLQERTICRMNQWLICTTWTGVDVTWMPLLQMVRRDQQR